MLLKFKKPPKLGLITSKNSGGLSGHNLLKITGFYKLLLNSFNFSVNLGTTSKASPIIP